MMSSPVRPPEAGAGSLAGYQGKRDFGRTPEPAGGPTPSPTTQPLRFVVQRHRSRRLHYDLRFEIGDVLVSWAVPKGPTLDPAVRRAAVHVEDHPVEYLHFEGVIPAGQYGGGDVIVWDCGTWQPHGTNDPAAAVAAGELHADLYGHKLRGRLVLVRRSGGRPGKEEWLLLHKRDEHATAGWDPEAYPRSVLSDRTNEQVQAEPARVWRSDLPAGQASVEVDGAPPTGPSEAELAALAGLGTAGVWQVFGRELPVTNLDKVLFPARPGESPVTKREFLGYAARIAPVLLPYLMGRPLNMHRYPNGADSKGFWHKQLPGHAPAWLPRWENPQADRGETRTYLVVNEPAALVWAANFGALEWHAWTSRTDHPDQPTYALIDLDPGSATSWPELLVLARLHRTALEHLGVRAAPKVTGRRGIQIWIPIEPGPGFAATRRWVEQLSRAVAATVPELVSWQWEVRQRSGHARLDYTQNAINKTLVAPYSPRPAPGGPVSAPIRWDELDDPALRPDEVTIRTVQQRLTQLGDPFQLLLASAQQLPPLH